MSRLIRVSFIALLAISAAGASANIPNASLSIVPDAIVCSPGARQAGGNPIGGYLVHVEGPLGPVSGSFVEVEIAPDADALVSWCAAPFGGGSGQQHPILTGTTNLNGDITFEFYGGGCLDPADFVGQTWIAQVRADGITLEQPYINSPDEVNTNGKKATDLVGGHVGKRCDLVAGVLKAQVTLSDAVAHTRPIKLGLREACTKFTPPFSAAVNLSDASFLTPYIKNGVLCNCQ
jgi:hypothetical protein